MEQSEQSEQSIKDMFDNAISGESDVDNITIPETGTHPYIIKRPRSEYITKDIIVVAVAIIGICSLFVLAKPEIILTSVLSGLFGMSVPNNKH